MEYNNFYKEMKEKLAVLGFALMALLAYMQTLGNTCDKSIKVYQIQKRAFGKNGKSVLMNVDHEHGYNLPGNVSLEVELDDGSKQVHEVKNYDNKTLSVLMSMEIQNLKRAFIRSPEKLDLKIKGRLLTEVQEISTNLRGLSNFLGYTFAALRSLTIIALITNTLDFFMPMLLFIELFQSYGLWTHDPHIIGQLLNFLFTTKIDVFNLVRGFIVGDASFASITTLRMYGFTNSFFLNVSGEYIALVLLLIGTILIKVSNIFIKNQRLRALNSKLRPRWNGYVFWLIPRSLILAGYQFRSITTEVDVIDIINCILGALVIAGSVVFIIFMILQVKKLNSKLQYIEQSRLQIGLANRIDYLRDFQFDCLQYSILYYPSMNTIRIVVACISAGFAPDFHYVQYGVPIVGEIFYMMIQISCPCYTRMRDKIVYPLMSFLFITYILCYITVGLIYQVGHLQLVLQLEIAAFSLIVIIFFMILGSLLIDFIQYCKERKQNEENIQCSQKSQVRDNSEEQDTSSAKTKKKITNKKTQEWKAEDMGEIDWDDDLNPKDTGAKRMQVKKIKKGKVI